MTRVFLVGPGQSRYRYPTPPQAGRTIRHLVRSEDSEGRYTLIAYQVGYNIPPHVHDTEDESIYLLKGEILVHVGATAHRVTPGTFVFMPRGVPHAITIVEGPWEGLSISAPAVFDIMEREVAEAQAAALAKGRELEPSRIADIRARYGMRILTDHGIAPNGAIVPNADLPASAD